MVTKKKAKKRTKTVYTRDEVDAKLLELAGRINTTNERAPLPMPGLGATMASIDADERMDARVGRMRVVIEGFVDKRLKAYFDAHPSQYADMQNLNGLRERLSLLEQWKLAHSRGDAFGESDKSRLIRVEQEIAQQKESVAQWGKLGLFARIKKILFRR